MSRDWFLDGAICHSAAQWRAAAHVRSHRELQPWAEKSPTGVDNVNFGGIICVTIHWRKTARDIRLAKYHKRAERP